MNDKAFALILFLLLPAAFFIFFFEKSGTADKMIESAAETYICRKE